MNKRQKTEAQPEVATSTAVDSVMSSEDLLSYILSFLPASDKILFHGCTSVSRLWHAQCESHTSWHSIRAMHCGDVDYGFFHQHQKHFVNGTPLRLSYMLNGTKMLGTTLRVFRFGHICREQTDRWQRKVLLSKLFRDCPNIIELGMDWWSGYPLTVLDLVFGDPDRCWDLRSISFMEPDPLEEEVTSMQQTEDALKVIGPKLEHLDWMIQNPGRHKRAVQHPHLSVGNIGEWLRGVKSLKGDFDSEMLSSIAKHCAKLDTIHLKITSCNQSKCGTALAELVAQRRGSLRQVWLELPQRSKNITLRELDCLVELLPQCTFLESLVLVLPDGMMSDRTLVTLVQKSAAIKEIGCRAASYFLLTNLARHHNIRAVRVIEEVNIGFVEEAMAISVSLDKKPFIVFGHR